MVAAGAFLRLWSSSFSSPSSRLSSAPSGSSGESGFPKLSESELSSSSDWDSFLPASATTVLPSLLSPPPFVERTVPVAGTSAYSESPSSDDVEPLTLSVEGVKKKDVALILPPGLTPEE